MTPRALLISLLLIAGLASSAEAQTMSLKVQGYTYGGSDAWGYTYHIPGPPPYYTPGAIPYGTPFTLEFRYQLPAIGPDLDPSANGHLYDNRPTQIYYSQPSDYPAFLSADLTINSITVAVDTRWWSKMDHKPNWDSLSVSGSANRGAMDPNGGQGAEGVSLSLRLFGQAFDPGAPGTYLPATGYASNGEVYARIFQDNSPMFMSFYPPGRFDDGLYHFVNFHGITTRMDLTQVTSAPPEGGLPGGVTPVPEPSTYGLLGAAACAGLGLWRRRATRRNAVT